MEYVVTNIRVKKDDLKKLKIKALEQDRSVSSMLRELIKQSFVLPQKRTEKKREDIFWRLAKRAVKTKDKKLSAKIDDITNINANSISFDFLKKEPDLYSVKDLKKRYA